MAIEQDKMGLELYKILAAKNYGYSLTMYDTTGAGTTTPLKAKWIYIKPVNFMLQLPDPDKSDRPELYFWKQQGEYDEVVEEIITRIRAVAQQFGVGLTVNDFEKQNAPKSFAKLVKRHNEEQSINESVEVINEGMAGSSYKSYYVLENARLVITHSRKINEEVRGSRTRNIKDIFVERDGERYRYPTNYLHGAQAMCRHLNQGGDWNDRIGKVIKESGIQISQLRTILESSRLGPRAKVYISETRADMKKARGPVGYRKLKEKYEVSPRISADNVSARQNVLSGMSGLNESEELTEALKVLAHRDLVNDRQLEPMLTRVISGKTGVDPRAAKIASKGLTRGNICFREPMKGLDSGDIQSKVVLYAGKMAESINDDLVSIALNEIAQSPVVTPEDASFVCAVYRTAGMNTNAAPSTQVQELMDWIENYGEDDSI